MDKTFYVYAYLRTDGTPYYVGKGKEKRAYQRHLGFYPPKDKSRIIFIKTDISDQTSIAIEKFWIKIYGRLDLGTGILQNKTDGGEGPSGAIRSEKTLKKMSEVQMGRTPWNKGISWSKTKPVSKEVRENMSKAQKGKSRGPMPEYQKQKIKEAQLERWAKKKQKTTE